MSKSLITVLVPVKNEEKHLDGLFSDLSNQTYPHALTEIVFVDNASSDESPQKIKKFAENSDFEAVILHENPGTNFMQGLNEGVCLSHGVYVLRWDAHGAYPPEYNQRSVDRLAAGADVCGGNVEFLVPEPTEKDILLLAAEMSPFCSGGSQFRHQTDQPHQVKSVFHPSYTREILNRCGLWDKRMFRCEDNELHGRICRLNGTVVLDPAISSIHYVRPNFRGMLRQKYGNGEGIARLLFYARDCVSLFYLVPLAFFCAVILGLILLLCGRWEPLALLFALYFSCSAFFAYRAHVRGEWKLPGMFVSLHLVYGLGTLCGIIKCLFHPNREPQIDYPAWCGGCRMRYE